MRGRMRRAWLAVVISAVVAIPAGAETQLFFDDFDGPGLDGSKWTVLSGAAGITVGGSLLTMVGGPDHKRINTVDTFSPAGGSVVATARFKIETPENFASYQKFGFNVNGSLEGPDAGFYFDTLDPPNGSETDFIFALVWVPGPTNLLNVKLPATWNEFHDFTIEWTPTEVIFSVDGAELAQVSYASTDPLPVGVWNDRVHRMQTDWVEVVRRAQTIAIDIKPGSYPNCFNLNGHGVIPVAILGAADFDVANIDVDTLMFDGLSVRVRGKRGPLCSFEDANADGHLDLVCHFEDDPTFWTGGETSATLTGELYGGTEIEGSDSICIVP